MRLFRYKFLYLLYLKTKTVKTVFSFFLCTAALFAFQEQSAAQSLALGQVSLSKKLFVIQTKYFDLIFPKESELSALHIAQYADGLYRKAAALFDAEPDMRLPVVFTPETDVLNAYYTPLPYNRIVIYDAVPSRSLAVFSDTLVSVFYHELVHAVTLNIKGPFWRKLSTVLGDPYSPSMLVNLPRSFIEGASVSFESLEGEGRLNDSYSLHVLRQAKIEEKFPDWRDIAGSSTKHTDGSLPYIFGGAFAAFIQQKYGLQKYAEFWKESGRLHFFKFSAGIFEKVYGLKLSTAWQDFKASIEIPSLIENPATQKLTFFGKQKFLHLTSSPAGLAWFDGFSGRVQFLPQGIQAAAAKKNKPKILYATDLSERLIFSRDGKFLVSSGFTGSSKPQNCTQIYALKDDAAAGETLTVKNIRDAALIVLPKDISFADENTVDYLLAGLQTSGAQAELVLYDFLHLQKNAGKNPMPIKRFAFPAGTLLFEPIDIGTGKILCLFYGAEYLPFDLHYCGEMQQAGTKTGWQFFVYDFARDEKYLYKLKGSDTFPVFLTLSVSDTMLYMSCALDHRSQPVLAAVELESFGREELTCTVEKAQVSGGIFNPVQSENLFIYISRYYEHRDLSILPFSDFNFKDSELFEKLVFTKTVPSFINQTENTACAKTDADYTVQAYRPLKYMQKGLVVPFIGSLNLGDFGNYLPRSFSLGITALTMDPAERFLFGGGFGIDVQKKQFTSSLSAMFSENCFRALGDAYLSTSLSGVQIGAAKLYTAFIIPVFSNFNELIISNTLMWIYFRQDSAAAQGNTLSDTAELVFRHSRKFGAGFYERGGFFVGIKAAFEKKFGFKQSQTFLSGLSAGLHIPRLLPFNNPAGFTLNLPGRLAGSLYLTGSWIGEILSTIILFAYEIQRSLPFAPIFFQRLTLDGGVSCFWDKQGKPSPAVEGSFYITLALNTGAPTGQPVDIGLSVKWLPLQQENDSISIKLKFSLNL